MKKIVCFLWAYDNMQLLKRYFLQRDTTQLFADYPQLYAERALSVSICESICAYLRVIFLQLPKVVLPFFLLVALQAWGQPTWTATEEKVYLHLAEEVLLTGQRAWFNAYLVEGNNFPPQNGSQVIYVELLRPNGQQVLSATLKVTEGAAKGDWLLPDSLSSGWYQIKAYTQWMRNFPATTYLSKQVLVINPFQTDAAEKAADIPNAPKLKIVLPDKNDTLPAERPVYTMQQPQVRVTLTSDKTTYVPRENVRLNLRFQDADGKPVAVSASLAVRKVNPVVGQGGHSLEGYVGSSDETLDHDPKRYPGTRQDHKPERSPVALHLREQYPKEEEGMTLSGALMDDRGNPLADTILLFSIPGQEPAFDYYRTDAQGRFSFPISKIYGEQEIILQLPGKTGHYHISLDKKFVQADKNVPEVVRFPDVSPTLLNPWIIANRKRLEINRIYGLYKEDSSHADKKEVFRFYGAPNFERNLDEYIDLPTFEEVCREILPGIILKEKDEQYDFNVFDVRTRHFLEQEPMVLMDGVPVYDLEPLIHMPPDTIRRIETVNRRTYYGEFPLNGTIAVYSKSGKEYLNFLSADVFHQQFSFYTKPEHFIDVFTEAKVPAKKRMPDFRTLLYWEPDIRPDEQGKASLTFFNSDETGEFEVVVAGISAKGEFFSKVIRYQVAPAFN